MGPAPSLGSSSLTPLPAPLLGCLQLALESQLPHMDGHELAWTLWSLGRLQWGYPLWSAALKVQLAPAMAAAVGVRSMNPQVRKLVTTVIN
jgi:hypothetical protein